MTDSFYGMYYLHMKDLKYCRTYDYFESIDLHIRNQFKTFQKVEYF